MTTGYILWSESLLLSQAAENGVIHNCFFRSLIAFDTIPFTRAIVFIWAHTYYFTMSHFGNIFQNSGLAWSATAIGTFCSIKNHVKNNLVWITANWKSSLKKLSSFHFSLALDDWTFSKYLSFDMRWVMSYLPPWEILKSDGKT